MAALVTMLTARNGALVPSGRVWAQALSGLKDGHTYRVEITEPRNIKFHRLFFAAIGFTVLALNDGPAQTTQADLVQWLKLKLGMFDVVELDAGKVAASKGQTHAIAYRSIAFHKMDQIEFAEFVERAFGLIATDLAPYIKGSPYWADVQSVLAMVRAPE